MACFSLVHEGRNLERGHAVSFLGIFVSNFGYRVLAVRVIGTRRISIKRTSDSSKDVIRIKIFHLYWLYASILLWQPLHHFATFDYLVSTFVWDFWIIKRRWAWSCIIFCSAACDCVSSFYLSKSIAQIHFEQRTLTTKTIIWKNTILFSCHRN